MPRFWEVFDAERLVSTPLFELRRESARLPGRDGTHPAYVIEAPDWVNIVPLTSRDEVVMIRQYRHATRKITLEIPGGMVDEGESPLDSAMRELREETGYESEDWELLGTTEPNPAILSNVCHTYLARPARLVSDTDFDALEDIEVVLVPTQQIPDLVDQGEIVHSLVIVALCHWLGLGNPA